MKKLLKAYKKIKVNVKLSYQRYLELPVDDKLVLVEGGQGSNINGNMFSMLKAIKTTERFSDYKCVFVVTQDTLKSAQNRMAFYGFDDVILAVRGSKQYCKLLATAKYLMTDNSFPPYFYKRDEQVFLNTWHGTPLKTLGKSDKSNLASLANIQKNYIMSDYALFPNEFTKDVFMEDYDLKYIFNQKYLIANYPRNYVFYDKQQAVDMKTKLGLDGKQVYAYMPTWRGTGRTADTKRQLAAIKKILNEFDKKLSDNQVLLVNLHFLLASAIDCSQYKHIQSFCGDYDTYEVLNACDGLVTDYSSVFFDYAVTGKKVILFAYDKEAYLGSRGVYISFDELPFPIVSTVDEVVDEMSTPYTVSQEFLDTYCTNGWIDSCEKLFDLMITGKTDYYELEKAPQANENVALLYVGALPEVHFDNIREYINENPDYNYVIAYRGNFTYKNRQFVNSLPSSITTYGTVSAFQLTIKVALAILLSSFFGVKRFKRTLALFYKREAQRMFYGIKPTKIIDFSCGNMTLAGILSKMTGSKVFVKHGDYYTLSAKNLKKRNDIVEYEKDNGFTKEDYSSKETERYLKNNESGKADNSFSKYSFFKNHLPLYFNTKNSLRCISLFKFKTTEAIRLADTKLFVGENEYPVKYIANTNKLSKKHFGLYSYKIPVTDLSTMPAVNRVCIAFNTKHGLQASTNVFYNAIFGRYLFGFRSPLKHDKLTNTVGTFRQAKGNRLMLYVRSFIVTDGFIERVRLDLAWVLSKLWRTKKARNLVLLYEKDSAKYEESASVTYETLIDKGYKYAYFICDKNYEYFDRIPEKYRKNIIYKYSFKHYLYFFKSKNFIGTEQPVHAIELRTFNTFALAKISSKNINFVFLQHGVMYMVSLDSEARGMFKRKNLKGCYRVVTSSEEEKKHFTTLGRHLDEDIYVCGLPKFDRNTLSPDADKIIIMPTWRPWEINMARKDFLETPYFKMVMKIYDSVPDELKDKVVILPHPLIVNELSQLPKSVTDKIVIGARYDDLLQQAKVLITDYSSIAYDAFYRGTNVMFYWEEKDYCMAQYGPTTRLMLNEENVYGDYFYNTFGLSQAIKDNYNNPQTNLHKERYSKIVQFHDGKNTERLIGMLIDDGIVNL